jgi:TatD DNase family protein
MIEWLDAHTHLDSDELYPQKDLLVERAWQAGVRKMLLVNSEATAESIAKTVGCAQTIARIECFASTGIHPHHATLYNAELEALLQQSLKAPRVIALGEIGLDFYYDFAPHDRQVAALEKQLEIALARKLPVVIHCRDAYGMLAEILRAKAEAWRGMIHCFTGNAQEAARLLDLGFYISFSGIVTFRKAEALREAALIVPADRLLIETDAPYLAPVPMRGKTNEPAFVAYIGQFLADLRKTDAEEFSRRIFANFSALFGL